MPELRDNLDNGNSSMTEDPIEAVIARGRSRLRVSEIGLSPIATIGVADLSRLLDYVEGMRWKPIESAPRDGTRILACEGGLDRIEACSWNDRVGCWDAESVTLEDSDHAAEDYSRPRKWMPLPPAPIHGKG